MSKLWLLSVCMVYALSSLDKSKSSSSCCWCSASPSSPKFSLYQEVRLASSLLSLQGGDKKDGKDDKDRQSFVTMAHCSLMTDDQQQQQQQQQSEASYYAEDMYDEDEDDDDDDDDDDGHSSMLSNASISRRHLYVQSHELGHRDRVLASANDVVEASNDDAYDSSSSSSNSHGSFARSAALQMRGGGGGGIGNKEEFVRKLIVAALVTLLYEGMLGHLLEFLKIVMQTAPDGTSYKDVLTNITKEKGLAGIWDGFLPWGVIQSIGKGGVFGLAHAMAASFLLPMSSDGKIPKQLALTLAGGIAGGFQGFVLSPLLLLKTRVMTNPVFRERMSALQTTLLSLKVGLDVVNNEGLPALMKGSNVFALKRVFDWSTRFYFADVFCKLFLYQLSKSASTVVDTLSPTQKIAADLLGGTASTLVTLPLDVLVAKTQDAKKAGVQVSAWDMITKDYKEGGWNGLYKANMRGFEVRLAHVCFTTVAMKTGTGFMYDFIYGPKVTPKAS